MEVTLEFRNAAGEWHRTFTQNTWETVQEALDFLRNIGMFPAQEYRLVCVEHIALRKYMIERLDRDAI